MKLADETVNIRGLHPVMRKALKVAEKIWIASGQDEGITITAGLNGIHSAGSWHYSGCAVDIRNRYFDSAKKASTYMNLKKALPEYDVVLHDTHIHIEPSDSLAKLWKLMI